MNARELRREAMRIGGESVHRDRVIEVFNPHTEQLIGTVPKATLEEVKRAFAIAHAFEPTADALRARRDPEQGRGDGARAHRRGLAPDHAETGLCRKDSLYEIGRVATCCCSAPTRRCGTTARSSPATSRRTARSAASIRSASRCLGVITAITPFNHPMNQVAHKVVPSIATNNRMVLKPSEKVPFSAILLADILYEAGLPPEMLQVVTGDPREIADELITNEHVDLVTFTGGVAIGKYIASKAGYRRDRARTRRQRPDHRHGRRRPRRGFDAGGAGLVQELGPALHRGQADAGARSSVAARFTELLVAKTRAWKLRRPDGRQPTTWAP